MSRDEATQRQVDAADPGGNTWLSANAGSGKTRVLTDRVARLLLGGVEPGNILCLTYTKAAASEMQNRLFQRLGAWAMLGDAELRSELDGLGVADAPNLRDARRLFARAIETPGGLKIQTIHAFCATILRRFPMEAGVSPDFKEMDDRSAQLLQEEIVEAMAAGPQRGLVEGLARHYSGAEIIGLTNEIVGNRPFFAAPVKRADVLANLGLAGDVDIDSIIATVFAPEFKFVIGRAPEVLSRHSSTMVTLGQKLAAIDTDNPHKADLDLLASAVLTQAGTVRKSLLTKPAIAELGPDADLIIALAEVVEGQMDRLKALGVADRTMALHAFAHPFVQLYETRKAQSGWLDFDDLILRASTLLNASDVAQWVLFRLDGGIDHILVDEAQDTSPSQWRVIDSLAREFMSGEGAHSGRDWSIFVVGDPKQSIYSFQGADPAEFVRMRDAFEQKLSQVHHPLQQLPLEYSFRSAAAILKAVDVTLADVDGLGDAKPSHKAFHGDRPGRVDLWPAIDPVKEDDPRPWDDPVDVASPTDHTVQLAETIADEIGRLIEEEQIPATGRGESGFRAVTPGDILILVQRRSELFHHLIRACKTRGLPIAGADRLRIGGEMAVKDLTALLSFLATPEDDLSLAAVLRSPLFGLSEDDLYRLAYGRKGYLWRALWDSGHRQVVDALSDLRDQADYLRPYDLIDRALTRHDGRRRLLGRLGAEAEDGIDAMLGQALAYERTDVPSLTGFLTWLDTEDVEIKRQMDSDAREIRVMTVHGAKGLESPIVILPDTTKRPVRDRGELVELEGMLFWRPSAPDMPAVLADQKDVNKTRATEERMRLLYVAMTRAESWLIVAGAGDLGKETTDSWHGLVRDGLTRLDAIACGFPSGTGGLRYQVGDWPAPDPHEVVVEAQREPDPPDWARVAAAPRKGRPAPLTPSDLKGAKVIPGASEGLDAEAAKRRGRQIHRLLEFLPTYPREDWASTASALLAFGEDAAAPDEVSALLAEATAVLDAPELAHLFQPGVLSEVEVSANVSDDPVSRRVHGIIDLLVVEPDRVLAIDFKSNMVEPRDAASIPEGILAQLGAYETALAAIYPDRRVESAVLWTRSATLMPVPPGVAIRTFRLLDGDRTDT